MPARECFEAALRRPEPAFPGEPEHRAAYTAYLTERLAASDIFVTEAINARARML